MPIVHPIVDDYNKILVVGDERDVEPLFKICFQRKAAALCCDGYISKPIDFKALKKTIMEFAEV